MWIEIGADIFETKDTKGLYFLLNLLTWSPTDSLPQYNIYIDSRNIANTSNYEKLDYNDKKLIDDEFDAFITTNGKIKYTVTSNNSSDTKFNLEEAIRFFIQPISIILENSKNDASFIKAIILHFDEADANGVKKVVEFMKNGWIQFENAGGCTNVENFIEGKLQSFNELAAKNNCNTHKYLRCIIVLDSDKEYPLQPKKPQYVKLEKYLSTKNINDYHLLEKRMMENYMPDEVIFDLKNKDTKPWIDVYARLNDDQKNFLNYKSGFSKEKDENGVRKPMNAEIKSLYDNVTPTNLNIIDGGLKYPNFKEQFPELFISSSRVNKFTLKQRANNDELERIFGNYAEAGHI